MLQYYIKFKVLSLNLVLVYTITNVMGKCIILLLMFFFQMVSGGIFLQEIFDMAIKLSSPVYYYVYDHANEVSFNSYFGPCSKKLGVTHGDEMISLFFTDGQEKLEGEDLNVSKLIIEIWTNFATTEYVMIVVDD